MSVAASAVGYKRRGGRCPLAAVMAFPIDRTGAIRPDLRTPPHRNGIPAMQLRHALLATLLIAGLPMTSHAQDPASADTFEREVLKALKASHEAKRSVTVHANGSSVSGMVKAIGPDVVVLANRERSTIMVRRERIDAVEAD
jgi:hypothetical protein